MYFTSDDRSQSLFAYQPTFNIKELKTRVLNMRLVKNQKEYVILNLSHYIKYFRRKLEIQFNNTPSVMEQSKANVHIVYDLNG